MNHYIQLMCSAPECPEWFEPEMPPKPEFPERPDLDDGERQDFEVLRENMDPPEKARLVDYRLSAAEYYRQWYAAHVARRAWADEYRRQRVLQWPRWYACEQMEHVAGKARMVAVVEGGVLQSIMATPNGVLEGGCCLVLDHDEHDECDEEAQKLADELEARDDTIYLL